MKHISPAITKKIAIRGFNGATFRNDGIVNINNDPNLSIFKRLIFKLKNKGVEVVFFEQKSMLGSCTELFFFDIPYSLKIQEQLFIMRQLLFSQVKKTLFCFEPPIVAPFNYFKLLHVFFNRVYTWNDTLVDNKKYFKFYWPQSLFGYKTSALPFNRKKFLVLINGNKMPITFFKLIAPFGRELYSKRVAIIEFYEKYLPKKLDLFGRGWNQPRLFNLRDLIFGIKKYQIYKGTVKDKIKLLSKYKFCICFENQTHVNGFVTEKIFDCLKARCVPVYLGADNITQYIPKKCFIDFRDFSSYEELSQYLEGIDEKQYNNYISNIEKLLDDKTFKERWFGSGFSSNFISTLK